MDKELDNEQIKLVMRFVSIAKANMENWKYIEANAEYLDKKRVADALTQMISVFEPIVDEMQGQVEIEALTRLDPYDLI